MYIQITKRCNMNCVHCGFFCNYNGQHMLYSDFYQAVMFAQDHTDFITIGGGEPTMHPRFWEILELSLRNFSGVWMATNGSKRKEMMRLASIIENEDRENFSDPDDIDIIWNHDEKLVVALSDDKWHGRIHHSVSNMWKTRSRINKHYEIRQVSKLANQGRAKKHGLPTEDVCICEGTFINPKGEIKLCGCRNSPIIGNIFDGIEDEWSSIIDDMETQCCKQIKRS